MEITFRLCPDDLIAYEKQWKHDKENARGYRKYNRFIAIIVGCGVWAPCLFIAAAHLMKTPAIRAAYATQGIKALSVFLPLFLPIVFFYVLWFGAALFRKKLIASSPIVQTDIRLRMDRESFGYGEHSIEWNKFKEPVSTETHLFLVDSAKQIYVVPLRIFGSKFEANEFVERVKGYWERGNKMNSDKNTEG